MSSPLESPSSKTFLCPSDLSEGESFPITEFVFRTCFVNEPGSSPQESLCIPMTIEIYDYAPPYNPIPVPFGSQGRRSTTKTTESQSNGSQVGSTEAGIVGGGESLESEDLKRACFEWASQTMTSISTLLELSMQRRGHEYRRFLNGSRETDQENVRVMGLWGGVRDTRQSDLKRYVCAVDLQGTAKKRGYDRTAIDKIRGALEKKLIRDFIANRDSHHITTPHSSRSLPSSTPGPSLTNSRRLLSQTILITDPNQQSQSEISQPSDRTTVLIAKANAFVDSILSLQESSSDAEAGGGNDISESQEDITLR
ncbi:hypothetical protein BCR39DRAFT_508234 [Naematelia encephala]|uniref:Uncharacterized protein n=1 Tax=Naematelia encephala TaxID=71784 RepID=A0A1Y2AI86_9TREE|nr:hypothetical protein BCR39DRAFT_508234 [Naematelia encephala]